MVQPVLPCKVDIAFQLFAVACFVIKILDLVVVQQDDTRFVVLTCIDEQFFGHCCDFLPRTVPQCGF